MADEGIDPRYAAQFQRGFDPAVHAVAATPVPATSTREGPVRLPGGPPQTAPRIGPPPRMEPDAPAPSAEPPATPATGADDEAPTRGWFLEWALLLAGVGLLLVAGVLFWQSVTDVSPFTGAIGVAEQTYITVRAMLPGPLLTAGVVAVSAWVVMRSVEVARR